MIKLNSKKIGYRGFFEIIYFYARRLWNRENAFQNLRLRFYLLWCLLFLNFLRLSQFFLFNHSKTSFKTFIVIQNYIWLILNHLFAYFLENLIWFKSCKYVLAEMFWLRFTGWWLVIGKVFGKYLAQSVAIKHFYTRNQTRPRKIPFCTSSQKQIPRNRNHPFSFIVLQI